MVRAGMEDRVRSPLLDVILVSLNLHCQPIGVIIMVVMVADGPRARATKMLALMAVLTASRLLHAVKAVPTGTRTALCKDGIAARRTPLLLGAGDMDATEGTA